ncbi:transmembrane protein 154 isoform X1 [Scyliorhinus torazame]|uniref:transmembrane protein 154 isoform X1 n=1 Tax=Scyliorhinus torazame TaxID=75743 RepID=UPI003B5C4DBD
MHTLCKGNMNQWNSRLYWILSVTFLLSGNSYSTQKNETTTSMIHATQSAHTENDTFIPLSTAITHHELCTNNCLTLRESKQASPTISPNTPAKKILDDVHKENATSINATNEHLRNRAENSQNTPATKILDDVHKENTISINATNEHLRDRSENSTYLWISSPAPNTISKAPSGNNKVIWMIVLPVLGLVLIGFLIAFLINHTHGKKQPLNNEVDSENPASPIFEEDVASVMEVEMDELDRWMGSMKKMSQQEGLPDISEDQDLNPKPSDPEL